MWGAVAGVLAAATVLALGQTFLENVGKGGGQESKQPPPQLPEPDEKLRSSSATWQASLWQQGSTKGVLERARKFGERIKK